MHGFIRKWKEHLRSLKPETNVQQSYINKAVNVPVLDGLLLEVECSDGVSYLVSEGVVVSEECGRDYAAELVFQLAQQLRVPLET